MYFVGEEAIADTDITQVSFVLFCDWFQAVSWQAKWRELLIALLQFSQAVTSSDYERWHVATRIQNHN